MKINVYVKSNTKHQKIEEVDKYSFIISVTVPAVEGKANKVLQEIIAKHFKTSPSCVELYKGKKSREKVFNIIC